MTKEAEAIFEEFVVREDVLDVVSLMHEDFDPLDAVMAANDKKKESIFDE